jgi:glycosyltransferase involved in cell wall biosynthesis
MARTGPVDRRTEPRASFSLPASDSMRRHVAATLTVRRRPGRDLPAPARLDGVVLSDAAGRVRREDLAHRFAGRVAVVIPAFNEADNLTELLPRVPTAVADNPTAVLVVDDGSQDETGRAALAGGATLARLPHNRGGGSALRTGYALMAGAGPLVLVTMDADGQHRPEELATLVEPVLSGRAWLAQGSRVLGSSEGSGRARDVGIDVFGAVIRAITGVAVSDCSNGFRAMRPELLTQLDLREPQFHAAELLVEALTRGFPFEEVPVSVRRRRYGHTKKPPTLRYGLGFAGAILAARRRARARARRPTR